MLGKDGGCKISTRPLTACGPFCHRLEPTVSCPNTKRFRWLSLTLLLCTTCCSKVPKRFKDRDHFLKNISTYHNVIQFSSAFHAIKLCTKVFGGRRIRLS